MLRCEYVGRSKSTTLHFRWRYANQSVSLVVSQRLHYKIVWKLPKRLVALQATALASAMLLSLQSFLSGNCRIHRGCFHLDSNNFPRLRIRGVLPYPVALSAHIAIQSQYSPSNVWEMGVPTFLIALCRLCGMLLLRSVMQRGPQK